MASYASPAAHCGAGRIGHGRNGYEQCPLPHQVECRLEGTGHPGGVGQFLHRQVFHDVGQPQHRWCPGGFKGAPLQRHLRRRWPHADLQQEQPLRRAPMRGRGVRPLRLPQRRHRAPSAHHRRGKHQKPLQRRCRRT